MNAISRTWGVLAVMMLASVALAGQTLPDTVSSLPWVVDGGAVTAAHQAGDILYLGGNFGALAPRRNLIGPAGVFSADTAELIAAEPALSDGNVEHAVSDGSGGWFFAGTLLVDGAYRNLIHVDASGRRTSCSPEPNRLSGISALARGGQTLYVGGAFESIGGVARRNLAAIDIPSCSLIAWNPGIDGVEVRALHVSGNSLFVGGNFTAAAGQPRTSLAQFDVGTGALSPWAPILASGYLVVEAIAANTTTVFVAGLFHTAGGEGRSNVAAFRRDTAAVTPLAPQPTQGGFPATMYSLAATDTRLYLGGTFDAVLGTPRQGLAAVDLATGTVDPWAPVDLAVCHVIVPAGEHVYVVGDGKPFKLDAAGGVVPTWQPGLGGLVDTVGVEGSRVALGGSFHTHHAIAVPGFVGLDLRTGARVAVPIPETGGVMAMAASGTTLYVGGFFSQFGGQPRAGLAAFDTTTGLVTPFAPVVTGPVYAMAVSGEQLYFGGSFSTVNGQARSSLAAVDRATGVPSAFAPPPTSRFSMSGSVPVIYETLDVAGGRVWAGGFRALFSFNATTGALASSSAHLFPAESVAQIVADDSAMYIAGPFGSFDGIARQGLARVDATSGQLDGWQVTALQSLGGVAVRDSVAFTSGTVSLTPGEAIDGIVAVDTGGTGALLPWTVVLGTRRDGQAAATVQLFDVAGGLVTGGRNPSGRSPVHYFARRSAGELLEPVTDLGVHLQGHLVTASWTPRATGAAPTSYRLIAGTGPGRADLVDLDLPATTTSIGGVVPSGVYYLRVAPRSNGVDGPMSREIAFVAGAVGCAAGPGAAPTLQVSGGDVPVLSWTPPPGADLTGYELRAGVSPGALDDVRLTFPAGTTALSTAGVPPGIYYAAVAAVNGCGVGLASNEVQVVVTVPGAPAPPGLVAQVSGNTVALSWTPPAGVVTGYVLEAGSAPGLANLVPGLALGPTPSLNVPSVPTGRYYVRVRARYGATLSAPSPEIVVDVP